MTKAVAATTGSPHGAVRGGMTILLTRGPEYFRELSRKSWDNLTPKKRKERVAKIKAGLRKAWIARDAYHARRKEARTKGAAMEQLIDYVKNSENPLKAARELLNGIVKKK